ncbi:Hypothetical protein A7982_04675 [Minicystis rosea]|nr:Hypothetical protein A7982_04675 [Minicystis rosea]
MRAHDNRRGSTPRMAPCTRPNLVGSVDTGERSVVYSTLTMPDSDSPPKPPSAAPHPIGHSKVLIQVSPWRDPTHGVLLTFTPRDAERACLRVLATSQNTLLEGSRYALGTEYWYATGEPPKGTPLLMKYEHGPWTVEEAVRRTADLPLAFSAPQDAKGLWKSMRRALPENATTHRFTAPDPENPKQQQIGLELTFTSTEGLVRCIWYRVNEPRTGYVWADLVNLENGLVWTPAPSLDALAWSFAQGLKPQ